MQFELNKRSSKALNKLQKAYLKYQLNEIKRRRKVVEEGKRQGCSIHYNCNPLKPCHQVADPLLVNQLVGRTISPPQYEPMEAAFVYRPSRQATSVTVDLTGSGGGSGGCAKPTFGVKYGPGIATSQDFTMKLQDRLQLLLLTKLTSVATINIDVAILNDSWVVNLKGKSHGRRLPSRAA